MPHEPTTTPRRRPGRCASARRPGFTIIELTVTIGIIAILIALFVVGFKSVGTGSQKSQTRTLLERMKNVQTNVMNNKAASQRLFRAQYAQLFSNHAAGLSGQTAYGEPWAGTPADADDALFKTGQILNLLLADAEAKRIFDDVPTERKKEFHFSLANAQQVPAPQPPNTVTFTLPIDAWGNPLLYVFDNWRDATGATGDKPHLSPTNPAPAPAPAGTASQTGGLTDAYSDSAKIYWEFPVNRPEVKQPGYAGKYIRPSMYALPSPVVYSIRSPDQMPFWVSAGPDGKFQTHDDNLYSFEN